MQRSESCSVSRRTSCEIVQQIFHKDWSQLCHHWMGAIGWNVYNWRVAQLHVPISHHSKVTSKVVTGKVRKGLGSSWARRHHSTDAQSAGQRFKMKSPTYSTGAKNIRFMLGRSHDHNSEKFQHLSSQMSVVDLMDLWGQTALVKIDFHSVYIEYVWSLNRTRCWGTEQHIPEARTSRGDILWQWSMLQICQVLSTLSRNGDLSQTSSPFYHQPIGRVERAIQRGKKNVKSHRRHRTSSMALSLTTTHPSVICCQVPQSCSSTEGSTVDSVSCVLHHR